MTRWLVNEVAVFLLAVQFLTRLPLPAARLYTEARLAATPRYYTLTGLLIGAFGALVFWGAAQVLPPLLAAILSTAATLLLTGAFHEDGLADTFDGVGGGVTREGALEIMQDSCAGGASGCCCTHRPDRRTRIIPRLCCPDDRHQPVCSL